MKKKYLLLLPIVLIIVVVVGILNHKKCQMKEDII